MTKFEKLVKEIMLDAEADGEPVTQKEAEEMARMELGAKEKRRYEKSDAPRKKAEKTKKVDEVKKRFINGFRVYLEGCGAKVEPLKTETEMDFIWEGVEYTVKLIRHRPPKKA